MTDEALLDRGPDPEESDWSEVDLAAIRSALVGLKPEFVEDIIKYLDELRTQFPDKDIGTVSFEPGEWKYEEEEGEYVKLGFYGAVPPFTMALYDDGKYSLDTL